MRYIKRKSRLIYSELIHAVALYEEDLHIFIKTSTSWVPSDTIFKWCEENIGESGKMWAYNSILKNSPEFRFAHETDAMAFILRWS